MNNPHESLARREPETLGEFNGFEVYVMPAFVTLIVDRPDEVANWYERALGFGTMFSGPIIHIRRRKYQDILLVTPSPTNPASTAGPWLSFNADGEIEQLAARASAAAPLAMSRVDPLINTPWNTRDLRVIDPAGHQLVFTERRTDPDPDAVARWQAAFAAARHG